MKFLTASLPTQSKELLRHFFSPTKLVTFAQFEAYYVMFDTN